MAAGPDTGSQLSEASPRRPAGFFEQVASQKSGTTGLGNGHLQQTCWCLPWPARRFRQCLKGPSSRTGDPASGTSKCVPHDRNPSSKKTSTPFKQESRIMGLSRMHQKGVLLIPGSTIFRSARSVAASYKPPMLVTRVRLPACAYLASPRRDGQQDDAKAEKGGGVVFSSSASARLHGQCRCQACPPSAQGRERT